MRFISRSHFLVAYPFLSVVSTHPSCWTEKVLLMKFCEKQVSPLNWRSQSLLLCPLFSSYLSKIERIRCVAPVIILIRICSARDQDIFILFFPPLFC